MNAPTHLVYSATELKGPIWLHVRLTRLTLKENFLQGMSILRGYNLLNFMMEVIPIVPQRDITALLVEFHDQYVANEYVFDSSDFVNT